MREESMFTDRADAGERLAELLDDHDVEIDVVLGIPRGGLPVAGPVAAALGAPLDVVVASKIGAPNNQELAIGAVASDGTTWRNEGLIDRLDVRDEDVERRVEEQREKAREKADRYRGDRPPVELSGKRVLVVDDGVATGATAKACLRQVEDAGARYVATAVPVGSPDAIEDLRSEADDVFVIQSPPHFGAVGQFYERFDQVTDEAAMAVLDAANE
jgi:predicted phosphoribosyltransferase